MSAATSSLATDDGYVPTFDETDLAYIEDYASDHYLQIRQLVETGVWDKFLLRAILTDFLTGVLVNANPSDE